MKRIFEGWNWRAVIGMVVVLAFALAAADPALAAKKKRKPASPSFFNSKETRSTNLKPFKKWNAALTRYSKKTAQKKEGKCASKNFNICHYNDWIKYLDSIRGKKKLDQLKALNKYMNKAKYITDKSNWGKKDYWATPDEFFAKFGDCEDYAITKFMSLKRLGWDPNDLRVVAVKDMNLKVGHAILAVFLDDKVYILDNQVKIVVEARKIRHYRPVFSINETAWWRHRV
jgi:predicted transglutaminase-like cysteine proteinase